MSTRHHREDYWNDYAMQELCKLSSSDGLVTRNKLFHHVNFDCSICYFEHSSISYKLLNRTKYTFPLNFQCKLLVLYCPFNFWMTCSSEKWHMFSINLIISLGENVSMQSYNCTLIFYSLWCLDKARNTLCGQHAGSWQAGLDFANVATSLCLKPNKS
jgi:hypothetical protein